ncbi:hypothetical protein RB195_002740 [Necator americanus]|uniref:Uncharacterized protein n=1 Tax=Necator americanus TaxID=51031 RepID=A0ABR1DLB9_NECAM
MPASTTFLLNYVQNYIFCCIFPDKTYNPVVFEEDHIRYHVFFGAFHVKNVLPKLLVLKTLLLFVFLIYELANSDDGLLRLF